MSIRTRWGLFSVLIFLLSLLSACQQDAYKIPHFGDGGIPGIDQGRVDIQVADMYFPDFVSDLPPTFPDVGGDACALQTELCNNMDDNCNGQQDEGFDKLNDPLYCDDCKGCAHLYPLHSIPGCSAGKCTVSLCTGGWIDLNNDPADGCEYECTPTSSYEVCDGIDNDCDGQVDNLPVNCSVKNDCVQSYGATSDCVNNKCTTPDICKTQGACSGAVVSCKGSEGWSCQYGSQVELLSCEKDEDCGGNIKCVNKECPGVVVADESTCDGIDGDCDGVADDPWKRPGLATALGLECEPTKTCTKDADCGVGSSCDNLICTKKFGLCKDQGVYVCDSNDPSKTTCQLTQAGQAPAAETCNNVDDDCNGVIDDNLTDEEWISISANGLSFQIFKYEASRPDATASDAGKLSTGRACSVSKRLPWASVTKLEAKSACELAGARLCTVDEWQTACRSENDTAFPYGTDFQVDTCNGLGYDTDQSTAGNQDAVLSVNLPSSCTSIWGSDNLLNMSGNVKEWTVVSYSGSTPTGYQMRGGAFDTPNLGTTAAGLSCNYELPDPEDVAVGTLRLPTTGFRCCKK